MSKRALFVLCGILLAGAIFGGKLTYALYLKTPAEGAPARTVEIPSGASATSIAQILETSRIIDSPFLFRLYARRIGVAEKIPHGAFSLREGMSIRAALRELARPGAGEVALTIPEGWSMRDIAAYLEAQGFGTREEFYAVVGTPATLTSRSAVADELILDFPFLGSLPSRVSFEGYLFPDTYRVRSGASAQDIARIMLGNFRKKVTPLVDQYGDDQLSRPLHEIVTMASILEGEVPHDEDRRLVADLLWRRLEVGMALQVDSTVSYATGRPSARSSLSDTQIDSPWNTYKHPGLPVGPINNPGLSSLRAALDPLKNDYWFFLTDKNGGVHYGRTLKEHGENREKFLE